LYTCEHFRQSHRAGRPKKRSSGGKGRPGPRQNLMKTISQLGPPPNLVTQEAIDPPNSPFTLSDVECPLCLGVLDRPLQLPCGALCCTSCVCAWVQHTPTLDPLTCPCCIQSHPLDATQIISAPAVLLKLLESLHVCCRRCHKMVIGAAAKHIKHLEGGCKEHLVVAEQTPSSSPSICTSPDNNILAIPTRGRVRANLAT
jgi:hypothetical protein